MACPSLKEVKGGFLNTRFNGVIGERYSQIHRVLPFLDNLLSLVSKQVQDYCCDLSRPYSILEIGSGTGLLTEKLLSVTLKYNTKIVALDHSTSMIRQSNCDSENLSIVECDALSFLECSQTCSFNIVVSSLTIHNNTAPYRKRLLHQIYRTLNVNGLFINADLYALPEPLHHTKIKDKIKHLFNIFSEDRELLMEWVVHEFEDYSPERIMREDNAVNEMSDIGFSDILIMERFDVWAVLKAMKL